MIGAPNSMNLNCKECVMNEAPGPLVSEEIADIFTNYNIDGFSFPVSCLWSPLTHIAASLSWDTAGGRGRFGWLWKLSWKTTQHGICWNSSVKIALDLETFTPTMPNRTVKCSNPNPPLGNGVEYLELSTNTADVSRSLNIQVTSSPAWGYT